MLSTKGSDGDDKSVWLCVNVRSVGHKQELHWRQRMPLISINFRPLKPCSVMWFWDQNRYCRYKSDCAASNSRRAQWASSPWFFIALNGGITVEISAEPAEGWKCVCFCFRRSQEPFHKSTLSELGQHQDFSTPEPGGRKVEQQWARENQSQGFRVSGLESLAWNK